MKLLISKQAKELGIKNPVVGRIDNVKVEPTSDLLSSKLDIIERELQKDFQNIKMSSQTKGFLELFSLMGYPNTVPAGEKLLDLIIERGRNSYNNLIDSYMMVSALYSSGIGMHDAKGTQRDITVERSDGCQVITPLFKTKQKNVKKDDLIYCCDKKVMAWLGKQDVDSNDFKVTEKTQSLLLVVLGNQKTSKDFNKNCIEKIFELIRIQCHNAKISYLPIKFI